MYVIVSWKGKAKPIFFRHGCQKVTTNQEFFARFMGNNLVHYIQTNWYNTQFILCTNLEHKNCSWVNVYVRTPLCSTSVGNWQINWINPTSLLPTNLVKMLVPQPNMLYHNCNLYLIWTTLTVLFTFKINWEVIKQNYLLARKIK